MEEGKKLKKGKDFSPSLSFHLGTQGETRKGEERGEVFLFHVMSLVSGPSASEGGKIRRKRGKKTNESASPFFSQRVPEDKKGES